MSIMPNFSSRIALAGDTQPLPTQVAHDRLDVAYLTLSDQEFEPPGSNQPTYKLNYLRVSHALLDRTFKYDVLIDIEETTIQVDNQGKQQQVTKPVYESPWTEIRALFLPKNKVRPDIQDGSWIYGRQQIVEFVRSETTPTATKPAKDVIGMLFVSKEARIVWQSEGAALARELTHAIRAQLASRDTTPIEFRGIYDDSCPNTCDLS